MKLMDDWNSELGQSRCIRNKKIRAKQKMPHTAGTKSFARLRNEMKLNGNTGVPPCRAELYVKIHTRKDRRPVDAAHQQIDEMNARMAELPEGSQDSTSLDDIYSQVIRRGVTWPCTRSWVRPHP